MSREEINASQTVYNTEHREETKYLQYWTQRGDQKQAENSTNKETNEHDGRRSHQGISKRHHWRTKFHLL